MTVVLAFLDQFSDAIGFALHERESVTGGVQVGGLAEIGDLTVQHMQLSVAAVAIACALALPLGLWLGHIGKGEFLAISLSNVGRAVPTLALIAFFIAFVGIGFANVLLALILLAIPPVLTNTYVGVRQVEREVVDAARGVGMSEAQIVRRVELPLALPAILAGVRIATVTTIGLVTVTALITLGGMGYFILLGLRQFFPTAALLGAVASVVLAVVADAALMRVQRALTPWSRAGRRLGTV